MTAQKQGMIVLGAAARELVPPQMDFVCIVWPKPETGIPIAPGKISFCTSTLDITQAVAAAKVMILTAGTTKPDQN